VKNQSTSETDVSLHLTQTELVDSYDLPILHAVTDGIVRIPERPPDTTPPTITILSPQNKTFDAKNIPLIFTINESTSWISYSLDGQSNVTITSNATLFGLSDGTHTVIVYANDTSGNIGASETVYFADDTTPPSIIDVSQTPLKTDVVPEDEVSVNATVTDNFSGVEKVTLKYTNGNGTWVTVEMTKIESSVWDATIPRFPYNTNITYIITAEDSVNNTITSEEMGYTCQYRVVSEFSTIWLLLTFMMATLLVIIFCKKRHLKFGKTASS
jgi:hypothetical protein